MLQTAQYFDLIIQKYDLPSDYALAKYLGISAGLISKHRSKQFGFGADLGLKIADALNIDPAILLLNGIYASAKRTAEKNALMRLYVLAESNPSQLSQGWTAHPLN